MKADYNDIIAVFTSTTYGKILESILSIQAAVPNITNGTIITR